MKEKSKLVESLKNLSDRNLEIIFLALDTPPSMKQAVLARLREEKTPSQIEIFHNKSRQQMHGYMKKMFAYYHGKPYEKH